MLVIFYFEDSFRGERKELCEKTRGIQGESVFKELLIARKMRVTGEFGEMVQQRDKKDTQSGQYQETREKSIRLE